MSIMQATIATFGGSLFGFVSGTSGDADNVSLIALTEPSPGYASGNLLVLLYAAGNGENDTAPAGWTVRVTGGGIEANVYSKVSSGSEGTFNLSLGGSGKCSAGVLQFRNGVYATGGSADDRAIAVPSRTFPAGGGASIALEQRTNNTATPPSLISGFTSLGSGDADNRGWRLQYRLEAAGSSAAFSTTLSSNVQAVWAQVDAA